MNWSFVLTFFVIFIAGSYLILSYQLGHRSALKLLPNILLCLAAAGGLIAFLRLLPSDWEDPVWSGLCLLVSLLMWVYLPLCLSRVARSGEILLELGRPRGGLVVGVVSAGLGLWLGADSIRQAIGDGNAEAATRMKYVSVGIFWITNGVYQLFLWFSKRSIREHGIVLFGRIRKWGEFEGFQWDRDNPSTLILRLKRRFPLWKTLNVRVPSEKQEAGTKILERILSANQ